MQNKPVKKYSDLLTKQNKQWDHHICSKEQGDLWHLENEAYRILSVGWANFEYMQFLLIVIGGYLPSSEEIV